jgi:hypothetical protein
MLSRRTRSFGRLAPARPRRRVVRPPFVRPYRLFPVWFRPPFLLVSEHSGNGSHFGTSHGTLGSLLSGLLLHLQPQRDSGKVLDCTVRPAMAEQARFCGRRRALNMPVLPRHFTVSKVRAYVPASLTRNVRFPNQSARLLPAHLRFLTVGETLILFVALGIQAVWCLTEDMP